MKKATCVVSSKNANPRSRMKIFGIIKIEETKDKKYTKITGKISGLKPGKHGFHIHESGDLSVGCKSLCSHFNPYKKNHGGPNDKERHVGDLGNIIANKNGVAKINIKDGLIKLHGKCNVIGRSFIIHEDEDDCGKGGFSDSLTTGHAGKRIACGVIGYASSCN